MKFFGNFLGQCLLWLSHQKLKTKRTMWKWKWLSHVQIFVTPWLYSPWNSPGQNTRMGSLFHLQGIAPTQGSNPGLPHCRQILYQLSHKRSPRLLEWVQFSSAQSLSPVWFFAIPWIAAHQASLSIINSQNLLRLKSTELVMPSNHLILCCSLLLPPSIFPSIRVFTNQSLLHNRWPKYWSFSFSISPSNEYSGLISFRIDWSDLLAVQWTFKSLLQYHSLKASILGLSAFFMVQLSHPHTWLLEKPKLWLDGHLLANNVSAC